ncbi:MAG: 16S rRNA (adenine(1518)-N(6)/adenine(1519)-N(6))-dimethyltransferase RsmA, partial [Oscillospiraceae bacterium]|nr:16S rRNA (adenine(1518)-N(6)/adenine(1519)-N(6))-dimethyltransferase RsmA [Oscillospiraceae bacterium]
MKLTNISVIKDLMNRHGFTFTKTLGQNFLINPSVCPRMAESLTTPKPPKTVLEIGAGVGVLTRELSKIAEKVIVFEIDRSLKPVLAETLSDCDNVEIIWGDALDLIDDSAFQIENAEFGVSVCANLPYYAATHIIMKLLEKGAVGGANLDNVTAMVQAEVAERFTAQPSTKQYGIVSVATRLFGECKTLFKVSRGSFLPAPKVDSAVIRIDLKERDTLPPAHFFRLVKSA